MASSLSPQEIAYQKAHYNQDRRPEIIAIVTVFSVVGAALYILRVITRLVRRVGIRLDDYIAGLALFSLIALNISTGLLAHYGIGQHLIRVFSDNPENFIYIGKTEIAYSLFYNFAVSLTKLSVLALLLRTFTKHVRWFTLAIHSISLYVVLWCVASILVVFLQCLPLSTFWGEPTTCEVKFKTSVSVAVLNIISDVAILIVPQPLIWKLQLDRKKKMLISGIFLIGIIATAVSIIRIPLLKGANSGSGGDITWSSVPGVLLTIVEPAAIFICANVPVLHGLQRYISESNFNFGSLISLITRSHDTETSLPAAEPTMTRMNHTTGED